METVWIGYTSYYPSDFVELGDRLQPSQGLEAYNSEQYPRTSTYFVVANTGSDKGEYLLIAQAVYAGIALVGIGECIRPSPARFPELWSVLRGLLSFAVLFPAWVWGLTRLYLQTWALVGLHARHSSDTRQPGSSSTVNTVEQVKVKDD